MVQIRITYQGQLRCEAVHGPSGTRLTTDAPTDNMGKGEAFSPTDLAATALGTCILTTMGIVAQRHNIDMSGSTCTVQKEMASAPTRRIGQLAVHVYVPARLSADDRQRLENAARTCPVEKSLHGDVQTLIIFRWGP